MDLKKFLEKGGEIFLPNLSIDLVIIGYNENMLKCLLLQLGGKWMLPGGYIRIDESVDVAVQKILKERTSLNDPHLKFLSVFGREDRIFGDEIKEHFEKSGMTWQSDYWFNNRFVTLAYYSLINFDQTKPVIGGFDEAFNWFNMDDLPDMWMDHKSIALRARHRLKEDIRKEIITHNLLPDQFTMPELHRLHEIILGERLDRSRFQKKMLSSGIFQRLPKRQKGSPGSNPYQYRLKKNENQ